MDETETETEDVATGMDDNDVGVCTKDACVIVVVWVDDVVGVVNEGIVTVTFCGDVVKL